MTDYRDVQDQQHRPDRQQAYRAPSRGGRSTAYWILGIAALVVIGALFLLGGEPGNTGIAPEPGAVTDPATNPAATGTLPSNGPSTGMEAPAADPAAPSTGSPMTPDTTASDAPAAGNSMEPAAPAPTPAPTPAQ